MKPTIRSNNIKPFCVPTFNHDAIQKQLAAMQPVLAKTSTPSSLELHEWLSSDESEFDSQSSDVDWEDENVDGV